MMPTISVDPVALRTDDTGTIRIGGSRVTLDTLVSAFRRGASPEQIVESFPTLLLADVYSAIAYYLNHRVEFDDYLLTRRQEADAFQEQMQARYDSHGLRERLLARRAQVNHQVS